MVAKTLVYLDWVHGTLQKKKKDKTWTYAHNFSRNEIPQALYLLNWGLLFQPPDVTLPQRDKKQKDKHLWICLVQFCSVQFSHSVVSDSLRPHELQHVRPPCPSPTPGVYSNPCLLSWWCHPTISSSVVPFSCPQSLPASGLFPMSQLFAWGGQSIGVSASASVLPMNPQDWSPLGWTEWISLQSKGISRVFSSTAVQGH